MSAVSTIAAGGTSAPASTTNNAFSSLSSEQFVKIMFSELSQQDPLQPTDSNSLLQQLSNLRNIQSGMDLSTKLDALVSQNEMSSASGLIGKTVSGIDDQGNRHQDTVQSIIRTQDGTVLRLRDGTLLQMSNVDQIVENAKAATGGRSHS
jgi:flagellar basal-body rod modification protein FlgD